MASSFDPSEEATPPKTADDKGCGTQALPWLRVLIEAAVLAAEARQHEGPAWVLRGLAWLVNLVAACRGCSFH
jgi:hypothetical protein